MLDIQKIRADFPILSQKINGKPLVYFDNGATSQKPQVVIDAIAEYYQEINANIHRGVHTLSQMATDAYEASRKKIQNHINAEHAHEVIFTSGTTHGINAIANGFASIVKSGDEVLVSALEHHSNIVPWQMLCERTGAILKVIPINEAGELIQAEYDKLLSPKTKIVAVNHISNALGTINPIAGMIQKAHKVGAAFLVDGAQAVPHLKPDVQALDCDFYVFSGHKICGPTGTGILYGKESWLDQLPPYQGGGEMIATVSFEKTTYADLPHKFEAGTPNIGDVIAFKYALDFINEIGKENIAKHENELLKHCVDGLNAINLSTVMSSGVETQPINLIGTAKQKVSVQSFIINGMHHFDAGMMLDAKGIAVRTGHHCTQPLMNRLCVDGIIRASFSVYNTLEEVDVFLEAVKKLVKR